MDNATQEQDSRVRYQQLYHIQLSVFTTLQGGDKRANFGGQMKCGTSLKL